MLSACPVHLILLDEIILTLLGEETCHEALHYAVFSNLLSFHPTHTELQAKL
jgi:hypothetical protein